MPIQTISSFSAAAGQQADVLVLGAGAAGLMCALTAARRGINIILLEKSARPGRKIAVSGGGKCNFTNRTVRVQDYVSTQTEFCGPALRAFPPQKMLGWFKAHQLAWEERDHGRLFGLQSAEMFIDTLLRECELAGVQIHKQCRVDSLTPPSAAGGKFRVECTLQDDSGQETGSQCYNAAQVVLALGSPAWAACGATDTGLKLAKAMGHSICPVRPVLVPLHMPSDWALRGLAGISVAVEIRGGDSACDEYAFTDALLFTHQGISGPATLLASCHWRAGENLRINFLPKNSFADLLDAPECGKLFVKNLLARHMPQRLAEALLPAELAQRKVAELSRKHRTLLAQCVHAHTAKPTGTAGLRKAEAAAGGVHVAELNPQNMQSNIVPGLYLAGEVLDVAGHLGGYNLHWAFASGVLAGEHVGART